jgi:dethiobiotin synthetase
MRLMVTGTDTGVGKTYFTRLLVETLRSEGIDAVAYKPVACGDREDALVLAQASGGIDPDLVNPIHLKTPVAPYVAGLLENRTLAPEQLVSGYHKLAQNHQAVIVEGAGGWEVPIAPGYRISDFAESLGLPVLIVAANRLGALNHILLTVDAIRSRSLSCAGIVLNQLDDELDTAMITNKGVVEDLAGVPLIEHLIRDQDFIHSEAITRLGFGITSTR